MGDLLNKLGPNAPWYLGGVILLLAIAVGWRDIARLSWMRIWAISSVSFSESIRRRVLWITPIAILGVMIVSQLQRPFDEQDAIRQTTKFALFTTGLVVVIIGILLACTSLPKEIENRVIFTVVTKPTTRLEIVLGKTLGFARVSATILLIMGLFTAVYLQVRAWNMRRDIAARLDAGTVEPLSRPTLEHYRAFGLLNAKSYAPQADLQFYAKLPGPKDVRRFAAPGGDNQILVPFDLTPDMFGSTQSGPKGMLVMLNVGYERNPNYRPDGAEPEPTTQPGTTQPSTAPAAFGPTPLLPVGPTIGIGFLDSDEAFLIQGPEINKGEAVRLPPPGVKQPVVIELSPDNLTKLANAARVPATRRVYFAITGANAEYLYSVEDKPVTLLIGEMTESGPKIVAEVPPAPDPFNDGQPSRPIFRGGYSRYGQQLRGDAKDMVAVYHFRNAGDIATDTANFEMKLGIDRGGTENAEEEDTVTHVSLAVRNTATGQTTEPKVIKPETNRMAYFSFPKESIQGGEFDLIVRCTTPQHMIGLQRAGLAMVSDTGSFYANLFKSLVIFWLLSVLVVSVAICCSTFLSWPIAVVLCVVVLLGKWGVEQLGDATKPGIGAQVATDFGFTKDQAQARVVSESVETLTKFLNLLAAILPDISRFPATEDIERGISIPGGKLSASAKEAFAFGIPLLLLGYVVLKNKEVAP